jgi:hypothetical protein
VRAIGCGRTSHRGRYPVIDWEGETSLLNPRRRGMHWCRQQHASRIDERHEQTDYESSPHADFPGRGRHGRRGGPHARRRHASIVWTRPAIPLAGSRHLSSKLAVSLAYLASFLDDAAQARRDTRRRRKGEERSLARRVKGERNRCHLAIRSGERCGLSDGYVRSG